MVGIEILKPLDAAVGNRRLLDELKNDLDEDDFTDFRWIVAYAKAGPLQRLKSRLEAWRQKGRTVRAIFGIDQLGTSKEALELALSLCDEVYVTQEKGITFHPKAYIFLGAARARLYVGSNNLTVGGTETNFEAALIVDAAIPADNATLIEINELWDELLPANCVATRKLDQSLLNDLLVAGDVVDEITIRALQKKLPAGKKSSTKKSGLSLKPPSPLPMDAKAANTAAVPVAPKSPISLPLSGRPNIWFESRAMTGGSRNILDLSMRSLVERGDPTGTSFDVGNAKFMRGGVEFFGQNPANINETKDVTINFEGVDYEGNTILFPVGKHPNGTWRLQIKGISSSGTKITDAFKSKGEGFYLVNKIIAFEIIQDDHYLMSVSPGAEIDKFRAASKILGRNGATNNAKLLGLL
jgi:HKD family nuclease